MSRNIDIEALCADKGLRITEQRRTIARILSEAEDHPDAEALQEGAAAAEARRGAPRASAPPRPAARSPGSSPNPRTTPTSKRCTSAPLRSIRAFRSPPSTA